MARDILLSAELDLKRINAQIKKLENKKINLFSGDARKLQKFQQPLGKIVGTLGEFEKSLEASNARVIAFGASAGAIYAVQRAVAHAFRSFVDVEKTLKDINVILGATSGNLKKFGNELFEISKKTGTGFKDVAEAATELSRQGLGVSETLKRTSNALTLAKLSGMDAKSSVEALTAAINSFNKAALTSTQITNKLANVDAKFAVSSQDLAEAIKRVASSAQSAGVSFDELVASVTAAQQMTARGGNVIGNSLKTIFTRVQRPRVIRDLEKLGVAVKDAQGVMLPTMKILKNMAVEFDNLGKSQKAQAAEMVGGVFQVNILKAVLSDLNKEFSVYNSALKASTNATDEAQRRIAELTKTFAGLMNETQANITQLGASVAKMTLEPAARKVLESFNSAFEKGQKSESIGADIGKGMLKGLGTFLAGPGLAIGAVAFVKLFGKLTSFAKDAFQSIMGLNRAQQQQADTQKQIYEILRKNPDILSKIQQGETNIAKVHDIILDKIQAENLALQAQQKLITTLGSSVGIGNASARTRTAQRKLGTSIGETSSHGFNSGSAKEFFGMISGGYSKKALRDPGIKQTTLSDGKKSVKSFINKHEDQYSFTNSKGKKVDMVFPEKGSKAYKQFIKNINSSGGFVPNFAPRRGRYYDFDETLGTYGPQVRSKDLFDPRSAGLASPTPLAKQLGGKTIKVLTARDVKATEPIASKLKSWGIEVEKILTTANMFRDLKISSDGSGKIVRNPSRTGRMKGYRNLNPAEKKALLLQRMQKKFGGQFSLTDDAAANIQAIKALKNPNITGELYKFAGQHAGRGSGNARGFVPNFSKFSRPSRNRSDDVQKQIADEFAALTGTPYTRKGGRYSFPRGTSVDGQTFSTWARTGGGGGTVAGKAKTKEMIDQGRMLQFGDHKSAMLVPREGYKKISDGFRGMDLGKKGPQDDIVVHFPIAALNTPVAKKGEETAFIKEMETKAKDYAFAIGKAIGNASGTKVTKDLISKEVGNVKGFEGSIAGAAGSALEVASRAGFGFEADKQVRHGADFDVTSNNIGKVKDYFQGLPGATRLADLKIQDSPGNRESMMKKILKLEYGVTSKDALEKKLGIKSAASGFNSKEAKRAMVAEAMAGADPEFRTSPFPHVADKRTQKTFKDVLKDHPNLGEAIKNSRKQQSFVPNFAPPPTPGSAYDPNLRAGLGTAILGGDLKLQMKDWGQRIMALGKSAQTLEKEQRELTSEIAKAERLYGTHSREVAELTAKQDKVSQQLDRRVRIDKVQTKRSEKMSTFMQRYERSQTKMLTASFVLPQAMGILSETLAKGSPKAQKSINAISSSMSTGAAVVGMIPGPAGMVAGALAAVGGSAYGLIKAQTDLGAEYDKRAEKSKEESTLFSDASSKYLSALEAAQGAYDRDAEGRTKSEEQIRKIYDKLEQSLRDVPEAYRSEIASISNLNEAREFAAKTNYELAEKAKRDEEAKNMKDKINELKGAGKYVSATDMFSGPNDFVEAILKLGGNKLTDAFSENRGLLSDADSMKDIVKTLRDIDAISEGQAEVLSRINEVGELEVVNGKNVFKVLDERLEGKSDYNKRNKVTAELLKNSNYQRSLALQQIEQSREQSKLLREQLLALSAFGKSFRTSVAEDKKQLSLAKAKGAIDLGSDYLTTDSKREYQYMIDAAEVNIEASRKSNVSVAKNFDSLTRKINETLSKAAASQTVGARGIESDAYASSEAIRAANDQVIKYTSSTGDVTGNNIQQLNSGLLNLVDGFDGLSDSLRQELRNQIKISQTQTTQTLAENERLRRNNLEVLKLNKSFEEQKAIFSELKSAFGGIDSFIKGGEGSAFAPNERLWESLQLMQPYLSNTTLGKVGAQQDYARGMLGVTKEILNLVPNATSQNKDIRRQMSQQLLPVMTDVYKKQIDDQIYAIQNLGYNTPVAGLANSLRDLNPEAMARAQIDSFLKGDEMPKHLQDMVAELQERNNQLGFSGMKNAFREGIDNSIMMERISSSYNDIKELLGQQENKLSTFDERFKLITGRAEKRMDAGDDYDVVTNDAVGEIKRLNSKSQNQSNELGGIRQNSQASLLLEKRSTNSLERLVHEGTTGHSLHTDDAKTHGLLKEILDKALQTQGSGTVSQYGGLNPDVIRTINDSAEKQTEKASAEMKKNLGRIAIAGNVVQNISSLIQKAVPKIGSGLASGARRTPFSAAVDPETARAIARTLGFEIPRSGKAKTTIAQHAGEKKLDAEAKFRHERKQGAGIRYWKRSGGKRAPYQAKYVGQGKQLGELFPKDVMISGTPEEALEQLKREAAMNEYYGGNVRGNIKQDLKRGAFFGEMGLGEGYDNLSRSGKLGYAYGGIISGRFLQQGFLGAQNRFQGATSALGRGAGQFWTGLKTGHSGQHSQGFMGKTSRVTPGPIPQQIGAALRRFGPMGLGIGASIALAGADGGALGMAGFYDPRSGKPNEGKPVTGRKLRRYLQSLSPQKKRIAEHQLRAQIVKRLRTRGVNIKGAKISEMSLKDLIQLEEKFERRGSLGRKGKAVLRGAQRKGGRFLRGVGERIIGAGQGIAQRFSDFRMSDSIRLGESLPTQYLRDSAHMSSHPGSERTKQILSERQERQRKRRIRRAAGGAKARKFFQRWIAQGMVGESLPTIKSQKGRTGFARKTPRYSPVVKSARDMKHRIARMSFGAEAFLRHPLESLGGMGEGISNVGKYARGKYNFFTKSKSGGLALGRKAFRFQQARTAGTPFTMNFNVGRKGAAQFMAQYGREGSMDPGSRNVENIEAYNEYLKNASLTERIGSRLGKMTGTTQRFFKGGVKFPKPTVPVDMEQIRERIKKGKTKVSDVTKTLTESIKNQLIKWKPQFELKDVLGDAQRSFSKFFENFWKNLTKKTLPKIEQAQILLEGKQLAYERMWNDFLKRLEGAWQKRQWEKQQDRPMTRKEWERRQNMRRQGPVVDAEIIEPGSTQRTPLWEKLSLKFLKKIADAYRGGRTSHLDFMRGIRTGRGTNAVRPMGAPSDVRIEVPGSRSQRLGAAIGSRFGQQRALWQNPSRIYGTPTVQSEFGFMEGIPKAPTSTALTTTKPTTSIGPKQGELWFGTTKHGAPINVDQPVNQIDPEVQKIQEEIARRKAGGSSREPLRLAEVSEQAKIESKAAAEKLKLQKLLENVKRPGTLSETEFKARQKRMAERFGATEPVTPEQAIKELRGISRVNTIADLEARQKEYERRVNAEEAARHKQQKITRSPNRVNLKAEAAAAEAAAAEAAAATEASEVEEKSRTRKAIEKVSGYGSAAAKRISGLKSSEFLFKSSPTTDLVRRVIGVEKVGLESKSQMGTLGIPKVFQDMLDPKTVRALEGRARPAGLGWERGPATFSEKTALQGGRALTGLSHLAILMGAHYGGEQLGALLSGGFGGSDYKVNDLSLGEHLQAMVGLREGAVTGGSDTARAIGGYGLVARLMGAPVALGLGAASKTHQFVAGSGIGGESADALGLYSSLYSFGATQQLASNAFNMAAASRGVQSASNVSQTGRMATLLKGVPAASKAAGQFGALLVPLTAGLETYAAGMMNDMENEMNKVLQSSTKETWDTYYDKVLEVSKAKKANILSEERLTLLDSELKLHKQIHDMASRREKTGELYGEKWMFEGQQGRLTDRTFRKTTAFQSSMMNASLNLPGNIANWGSKWVGSAFLKMFSGMDEEARKRARADFDYEGGFKAFRAISSFDQGTGTLSVGEFYQKFWEQTLKDFRKFRPEVGKNIIQEDDEGRVSLKMNLNKKQLDTFRDFINTEVKGSKQLTDSIYAYRTGRLARQGETEGLDRSLIMDEAVKQGSSQLLKDHLRLRELNLNAQRDTRRDAFSSALGEAVTKDILRRTTAESTKTYRPATEEEINKLVKQLKENAKVENLSYKSREDLNRILQKARSGGLYVEEQIGMSREEYLKNFQPKPNAGGRVLPTMNAAIIPSLNDPSSKHFQNLKAINEARIIADQLAREAALTPLTPEDVVAGPNALTGYRLPKLLTEKIKENQFGGTIQNFEKFLGPYQSFLDMSRKIGGRQTFQEMYAESFSRYRSNLGGKNMPKTQGQILSNFGKIAQGSIDATKLQEEQAFQTRLNANTRIAGYMPLSINQSWDPRMRALKNQQNELTDFGNRLEGGARSSAYLANHELKLAIKHAITGGFKEGFKSLERSADHATKREFFAGLAQDKFKQAQQLGQGLGADSLLGFTKYFGKSNQMTYNPATGKYQRGIVRHEEFMKLAPGETRESPIDPGVFFRHKDGQIQTGRVEVPEGTERGMTDPTRVTNWTDWKKPNEVGSHDEGSLYGPGGNRRFLTLPDYQKYLSRMGLGPKSSRQDIFAQTGIDPSEIGMPFEKVGLGGSSKLSMEMPKGKSKFFSDEVPRGHALYTENGIIFNKEDVEAHIQSSTHGMSPEAKQKFSEEFKEFKRKEEKTDSVELNTTNLDKLVGQGSALNQSLSDLNVGVYTLNESILKLNTETQTLNTNMKEFSGLKDVIAKIRGIAANVRRIEEAANQGVAPRTLPQKEE